MSTCTGTRAHESSVSGERTTYDDDDDYAACIPNLYDTSLGFTGEAAGRRREFSRFMSARVCMRVAGMFFCVCVLRCGACELSELQLLSLSLVRSLVGQMPNQALASASELLFKVDDQTSAAGPSARALTFESKQLEQTERRDRATATGERALARS